MAQHSVTPPHDLFDQRSRPAPISSLFPYTTLFRSRLVTQPIQKRLEKASKLLLPVQCPANHGRQGIGLEGGAWTLSQDRKSTRLNSSHRTISYAVFCLKKKKNKNN